MFFFGAVLVVIGLIGVGFAFMSNDSVKQLDRTAQQPVGQLVAQHNAAVQSGYGGRFRQEAEVGGWTTAAPQGPVIAPQSGQPCVWFTSAVTARMVGRRHLPNQHTQTRRYEVSRTDSGNYAFGIRDETGIVFVRPGGYRPDDVEQVMNRFEPHHPNHPMLGAVMRGAAAELLNSHEWEFAGYEYEEWILRPDVRVFVHGTVTDTTGQPIFNENAQSGDLTISTRTKTELQAEETSDRKMFAWGGGVIAAVGVLLIVINTVLHHHH